MGIITEEKAEGMSDGELVSSLREWANAEGRGKFFQESNNFKASQEACNVLEVELRERLTLKTRKARSNPRVKKESSFRIAPNMDLMNARSAGRPSAEDFFRNNKKQIQPEEV